MAGGDDLIDYSKPKKSTPRSKYAEDSSGASVAEEDGNGFANGNGHSNEKDIVDEKGRGYETDRSRRSKKSKRSSGSVRSGTSGRSGHSRRSRRRNPPSDVEEAAEEDEDIAEEDDAEGDSDLDGQDFHDDDDFSDDVSEEGPAPEYVALHEHILPTYGNQTFVSKINLFITQSCAFGLSSGIFGVIVVMAFTKFVMGYLTGAHKRPKPEYDEKYYKRELFEEYTTKTEYYALYWGYRCDEHKAETEDGFTLKLYHIQLAKKPRRPGPAVLLQCGFLCSSTVFVVNEERSLAFWLVEQGYDVWLANIRTQFSAPHKYYSRNDPRYWNWTIREIGLYDTTAAITYVSKQTRQKVAFVGHSQGAGQLFVALSRGQKPQIARKVSCFVALAPAVYLGPSFYKFPLTMLAKVTSRDVWRTLFGVRRWIPLLAVIWRWFPGALFGFFAYPTSQYLFDMHDNNWAPRQTPKHFRGFATPQGSEHLYHYSANFLHHGCLFEDQSGEPWFTHNFPPLLIMQGTQDNLVDSRALVDRIKRTEDTVELVKAIDLKGYDHFDLIWHVNAHRDVFIPISKFIDKMTAYNKV